MRVAANLVMPLLISLCPPVARAEPVADDWSPCEVARKMGQPYYSGAILPTPQQVDYRDEYVELIDGPGGEWRCRVEVAYDGSASELVRRLLDRRLAQYTDQFPGLRETEPTASVTPVTFMLAADERAKPLLGEYGLATKAAQLKPQGYVFEVRPDGVFCAGRDDAGLVNGLASLLQLTHVRDGKLVARCASVHDWPTFDIRYTSEYFLAGTDFLDWMIPWRSSNRRVSIPSCQSTA